MPKYLVQIHDTSVLGLECFEAFLSSSHEIEGQRSLQKFKILTCVEDVYAEPAVKNGFRAIILPQLNVLPDISSLSSLTSYCHSEVIPIQLVFDAQKAKDCALALNLPDSQDHPDYGLCFDNKDVALFYDVNEKSIRTLKKRLTDEQAIEQNRHWLAGPNNKTLWTFSGFLQLGMRLTSPVALQHRANMESLVEQGGNSFLSVANAKGKDKRMNQNLGIELFIKALTKNTAMQIALECQSNLCELGVINYLKSLARKELSASNFFDTDIPLPTAGYPPPTATHPATLDFYRSA